MLQIVAAIFTVVIINIKILHIIWRLKAHYHHHKSSPLVFNLTQMNPVNALTS